MAIENKIAAYRLQKELGAKTPAFVKELADNLTIAELKEQETHLQETLTTQEDGREGVETQIQEIRVFIDEFIDHQAKNLSVDEAKLIIKSKGLNIKYNGGLVKMYLSLSMGNENQHLPEDFKKALEDKEKASKKAARTLGDYQPDEIEMGMINRLSKIDLMPSDVVSFLLKSADMNVDRGSERFTRQALQDMAEMSVNKPVMMDHQHTTMMQVGKIYDAKVGNGRLEQKAFFLTKNQDLIFNIACGIYDKLSVGFGLNLLTDFMCSACSSPMVSKDCSHYPGQTDEKGNPVIAIIKRVRDFYEVSLVAIPMQPAASIIGKSFYNSGKSFESSIMGVAGTLGLTWKDLTTKTFWLKDKDGQLTEITSPDPNLWTDFVGLVNERVKAALSTPPEKLENPEKILKDLEEISESTKAIDESNSADTISNEIKATQGDSTVADETKNAENTETKAAEVSETKAAEVEVKAEPVLVKALTDLAEVCTALKSEIASLSAAQKEQAEKIQELSKSEKENAESEETIIRKVLANLVDTGTKATAEPDRFGVSVMKAFLPKEENQ